MCSILYAKILVFAIAQGTVVPSTSNPFVLRTVVYFLVVRHRRERQHFGQPAAAIRTALPATASADPEPLTNEMQAHGLMALMRSPIHRAQGTAQELPNALYLFPSGLSGLPRHGMLV